MIKQTAECPSNEVAWLRELLAKTKFKQQVRARFLANHVSKAGGWTHIIASERIGALSPK